MEATNRQVISTDPVQFGANQAGMRTAKYSVFRFCTTVADGEFETHVTPSYRDLGQIAVVIQAKEGV